MPENHFRFSLELKSQQYVSIQLEMPVKGDSTTLRLPVWRPGRYELGNFAKNVRNFKIYDLNNQELTFTKADDSTWRVDTTNLDSIFVHYEYFANELNSGSTFVDHTQLYVNPVNCCVFTEESFDKAVSIELDIPENWDLACSLRKEGNTMFAKNFDELFDSPFVASSMLQVRSFNSHNTLFHVWFNGDVKPDWTRVLHDFKRFTDKQIEAFGAFPVEEYHYINQIVPFRKYHGVEHQASTIITLGPTFEIFDELYADLLGVSSHELYHAWNVKSIRPIEMYPYDFTKENYSPMGYLCEGVTTYQGDLFLLKSGVFSEEEFFNEFSDQFQKHFDNPGRLNYSVRNSSIDTWLDGYEPGAPGRKVSIYTEGCLLAFITDVFIMKATSNQKNIDDLMRHLYEEFYMKGKGVSEADYLSSIEFISGRSFDALFEKYFVLPGDLEDELNQALDYVGCTLQSRFATSISERNYGFKYSEPLNAATIKVIYPDSPADRSGLMLEDEIFAVNKIALSKSLDKWLKHFQQEEIKLLVRRNGRFLEIPLMPSTEMYFSKFSVERQANLDAAQLNSFAKWIS